MLRDLGRAGAVFALALFCCATCWSLLPLAVGLRTDVVMSGSMAPGIEPGDVVISVPTAVRDLRPGMTISFTDPADPGRNLIHRFIARAADGSFQTRGDANSEPDSVLVPAALIHGQSRIRIPAVGLPAYWARTGQYRRFACGAAVLAVLISVATRRAPTGGRHRSADQPMLRRPTGRRRRRLAEHGREPAARGGGSELVAST